MREWQRRKIERDAEDRWTTKRILIWQGWDDSIDPTWYGQVGDSGRFYVDTDGGLWYEADPEACEEEQKHLPRWHPSEYWGWYYCKRCGAQGIDWV